MKTLIVIASILAGMLLAPFAPFNAGLFVIVVAGGAGLMFVSIF